jgi:hypothetical protein
MIACSKSSDSGKVADPGTNDKAQAGPYVVDFGTTKSYQHSFKIPINQNEGKVEYFITMPEATDIVLTDTSLTVTGCPASQVIHQTFWLPDSAVASGQYVVIGSSFRTLAGTQGTFLHILKGLDGCTDVNLSTTLTKKDKPAMKCKESRDPNCQVQVYCKESDALPTNYIEVEAWKEYGGISLYKFMNHGDGTRSQMSMNSAAFTNDGTQSKYSATSNSTYLRYNNTTRIGLYYESIAGQSFTTDVNCTVY